MKRSQQRIRGQVMPEYLVVTAAIVFSFCIQIPDQQWLMNSCKHLLMLIRSTAMPYPCLDDLGDL